MKRSNRLRAVLPLVVLGLVLSGCGNDEDEVVDDLPPDTGQEEPTPAEDDPTPEDEPTPTPTPAPAPNGETYEVQSGDTLSAIAERFGTTIDALVEANELDDPDAIFPGDELVIPVDD